MAEVRFTENIQRHVACPPADAHGETIGAVLEDYFARHPQARGYVLDDQGAVRKHMTVFVDGRPIRDRSGLTDSVTRDARVYVMQALSGG